jgi:hypothetical protein
MFIDWGSSSITLTPFVRFTSLYLVEGHHCPSLAIPRQTAHCVRAQRVGISARARPEEPSPVPIAATGTSVLVK